MGRGHVLGAFMAKTGSRLHGGLGDLMASPSAPGKSGFASHLTLPTVPPSLSVSPDLSARAPGSPLFAETAATVAIDAIAQPGQMTALFADLLALGLENGAAAGRLVSGLLPITALPELEALTTLHSARPALTVRSQGDVVSQGDRAVDADLARAEFGVDGTGVSVGALSDSFDALGGADADFASGDLPDEGVQVLQDFFGDTATDEGRAILQIIHDVAPGADLLYATAFGGQANFARNIERLASAGADVIIDDVTYLAEPFFQDGIPAQAVDRVVADGAVYFSSAGNTAQASYEAPFRSSGISLPSALEPGAIAHDWDPGPGIDPILAFSIRPDDSLFVSLQWDQPFASLSDQSPGAASDIDIYVVDLATGAPFRDESGDIFGSADFNIGGDPVEVFRLENDGNETLELGLVIENAGGPDPGLLKAVFFDSVDFIAEKRPELTSEFVNPTVIGHAAAEGAIAVGAAFYQNTPRFGTFPPVLNSFSAVGPSTILFDVDGNRLAQPDIRLTPQIVAPDGVDTTFFGSSDLDSTGFPNFFGTSAAAPHAAAVTALLLDANPDLSPAAVRTILQDTAIDIGAPGFDRFSGAGLIQADQAVRAALALGPENNPPVASDDVFSVQQDDVLSGSLLADNGAGGDLDPDGDPVEVVRIDGAVASAGDVFTLPSGARLTLLNDGQFTYDPAGSFVFLGAGITTEDGFTYRLSDGEALGNTAQVSITVTGINDAPQAQDDELVLNGLTATAIDLFADNGNGADLDPDEDALALVAINNVVIGEGGGPVTLPSGAVVSVGTGGSVTYDPGSAVGVGAANDTVIDSFTYTAGDSGQLTDAATVTVRLSAPNDPPVAQDDFFEVLEDGTLTGNVLEDNGTGPDSDPDGDALTVALLSGPAFGTLELTEGGRFDYAPTADFFGADEFVYTLSDGVTEPVTGVVTLQVLPVNDAPLPASDLFMTDEETPLSGNLFDDNGFGVDTDREGEALSIVAIEGLAGLVGEPFSLASGAVVTIGSNGDLTYDPAGAFVDLRQGETAVDRFAVTVADASGATAPSDVQVTVQGLDAVIGFGPAITEIAEGDSGSVPVTLNVTRSGALDTEVTVSFAVEGSGPNPAQADDFLGGALPSGTVTFAAGVDTAFLSFEVAGDTLPEPTETFLVTLFGAEADQGAAVIEGAFLGFVISDNDEQEFTLVGTEQRDVLRGTFGDDVIDARGGNDIVLASFGDDVIVGGEGNDLLLGESGDDTFEGGAGDDILFGGSGADRFVFEPDGGNDRIIDFGPDDIADLTAFVGLTLSDILDNLVDGSRGVTLILSDDTTVQFNNLESDDLDPAQFLLADI